MENQMEQNILENGRLEPLWIEIEGTGGHALADPEYEMALIIGRPNAPKKHFLTHTEKTEDGLIRFESDVTSEVFKLELVQDCQIMIPEGLWFLSEPYSIGFSIAIRFTGIQQIFLTSAKSCVNDPLLK
jgi:hypothetical protein